MKDDVITMHAAVDDGAANRVPSHKSAADIWDMVNERPKKDDKKKDRFKKTTPTERWWNKFKRKQNPSSATPAQDVESTVPVPASDEDREKLWSRLPVIDPNKTKREKATDVGGGAKFDPNDPTVTGKKLRPFLENIKGSFDAHREKFMQWQMDQIDELEEAGDVEASEDATRKLLIWLETQRINQKTLESIQYFLNETTPKGEGNVPVVPGQYPAPGSDPSDLSQPTLMQKDVGGASGAPPAPGTPGAGGATPPATGTTAPPVAPVAPQQQQKTQPTAPTGTTPPTKAPVAPPIPPQPPQSVQTTTSPTTTTAPPGMSFSYAQPEQPKPKRQRKKKSDINWWSKMAEGEPTEQAENLQRTYELTYVLSILASLGVDVADIATVKRIMAYNDNHSLVTAMDNVPEAQWAELISKIGKPGAANKDLMQSRPRWWSGSPTPPPAPPPSKEDKWRQDWGLPADAPYTPRDPNKPFDDTHEDPNPEPSTLEEWIYDTEDDPDFRKQSQAQSGQFEWLYWMSEAGFPVDQYVKMKHLTTLFPNNIGAQASSQMSEATYNQILQSGIIEQWAEPIKENYDLRKPPPEKIKTPGGEGKPVEPELQPAAPGASPEPVILPGFQLGEPVPGPGGKPVTINLPHRRSQKAWDLTVATIGMAVRLRVEPANGFIVGGTSDGNLMVWDDKTKQVRNFRPNQVEQDRERRVMPKTSRLDLLNMVRKIRAQVTTSGPGGQQQLQTDANPGSAPRAQDGQPAAPGDMIAPQTNSPTMTTPDNSGTITQVNPDGSIVFTNQQGQQAYNAPGEPGSIVKNPGGTTTV